MPRRPFLTGAVAVVALATACAGSSSAAAPHPAAPVASSVTSSAAAPLTPTASRSGSAVTTRRPCGWRATPSYRHVVWIWMENRSYQQVLGAGGGAPNLARYARRCGVATNYQAITHPSLPNYLAAVAGGTHGISSDCSPATCSLTSRSLFGQLTAAGRTWRSWAESMRSRCDHASYGSYAARHNPAVYFRRIAAQCRTRDRHLGGAGGPFGHALATNTLPAFAFITPNLCHDGHDCATPPADRWLGGWLDRIVRSRAYAAGRTVVFVTWDEGVSADNQVATVVLGPTVRPRTRAGARFTHYSLLRTTEELLDLPRLGHARGARSMRGSFRLGR